MSGQYSDRQYRRLRAAFKDDCRRNRLPCSICKRPINYALPRDDDWSFELHHVKPTSTNPHLFWTRSNWSPSHARCNRAQGNKPAQDWVAPAW